MKKRLFCLLLTMAAVFSLLSIPAAAKTEASGTCGKNLTWTLEDGVLTIRGTGEMTDEGYGQWGSYKKEIKSVVMKDGVTSIGDIAFFECSSLTAIDVDSGNTNYRSVDGVLFSGDMTKLLRYPAGKTAQSYAVPSGVTSIGGYAFENCYNLISVTIPDSVTSIGYYAFFECSSLEDVYYGGSEEDWGDISIGFNNNNLTGATIHFEIKLFNDVSDSGEYYYAPVYWAVEKKITKGTGDNQFSPEDGCTRAQVVTFLWRYEGKPRVSGSTPFTDVNRSEYYASAVLWAVQKKVTLGTSDTTFEPENTCTRAQVVTFLYRDMA